MIGIKGTALCSAALLLRDVLASPTPLIEDRQTGGISGVPDCKPSSTLGLRPICWQSLGVEKYLRDWYAANAATANCATLGFAQCFLQANGYGGLTCDLISTNTCPPFDTTKVYTSDTQFYALWNIYSIYQFFKQYSLALTAGQSLAQGTVAKIVQTVAPPVTATTDVNILEKLLGATLSVASLVSGFAGGGIAVDLVIAGVTQTLAVPAVAGHLFPASAPGVDNRFVHFADIGAKVVTVVTDYQDHLVDTIKTVQGDIEFFMKMAAGGAFSQRVTTSLTGQSRQLYQTLTTHILSEALIANEIVVAKSPKTNPVTVARDVSKQIICPSLGPAGNCNQYWFDAATGHTYAFHRARDYGNNFLPLLQTIIAEGWVADLKSIFAVEGCQATGTTFNGATLKASCPAAHKICTYDYSFLGEGNRKEFLDCENDEKYTWPARNGPLGGGDYCVAASYLGPLLKGHVQFGPN